MDDQYQTKVESASKYRLRLSGIVLMNLVSNQGVVDSIDLPTLAYARPPVDSGGSFGATLRQSEIGFEAFGPSCGGCEDEGGLATRSGRWVSRGSERDQLRTRAVANGHDADGLDKHLGCGRAGYDFLFAELANIVCFAGRSGAFRCGKPMGLDSADTSGT